MEAKEAKEAKESQMEPRWSPDGSKGIRDGIPDGTQLEAKEFKIDSHDRIQVIQVTQVTLEQIPGT